MSENFDSLLARTERRNTAPPDQCPNADVLAAYLDATLARPERAAVEAHAADCSRCALQLGTIVRLEDESGHPQHAPRRGWWPRLAWMVPAATAVLVAAVYVARPSDVPPPTNAPLSDRVAAAPIDTAAPTAELHRAAPPPTRPDLGSAPLPARKAAPPLVKTAPAVVETPSMDKGRPQQEREESLLEQDQFADRTASASAPAAPAPPALARQAARAKATAAASSMLSMAPRLLVVRSPDGRVVWRVTGTRIERSPDGGSTWMAEHAPAAAHVMAGAAPSRHVCWLATASGKVLRRNEAGTWRDVSPSPSAAIARIESTAVLEATVVHTDGTTRTTVDGGRTWTH